MQLGGIAASQYVQTGDSRLSDARPPTAGSSNYIQNTTSPQAGTNFNISGNGTASGTLTGNVVSAVTQFNIGGNRALYSDIGQGNTFVGVSAGLATDPSTGGNSFFGRLAGADNKATANSFFGDFAGNSNVTGGSSTFIGFQAGLNNKSGGGNTFIGSGAGASNVTGIQHTLIGTGAAVGLDGLANSTAVGHNARVDQSNSLVLGSISGVNGAPASTNVGIGTTAPQSRLHVVGDVRVDGGITLSSLGAASSTQATLCRNTSSQIAFCNSSSLRYKKNVTPFTGGLDIVNRLRPINFTWKRDGVKDIGFGAEEVEKVAPLFTFKNDKDEIEGVRYDRLSVIFVNAFKEQQTQIERQQEQITREQAQIKQQQSELIEQRSELEALRKLVCRSRRRANVCK